LTGRESHSPESCRGCKIPYEPESPLEAERPAFELLSPKNMFNYFAGVVWDLKGFEPKPGVVTVPHTTSPKALNGILYFLPDLTTPIFRFCWMTGLWGILVLKEQYKNPQALIKSEMAKVFEGKIVKDSVLESKLETISERARLLYVGITGKGISLFIFL